MKLFLMTDLEGVAGVINGSDWLYPQSRNYDTAKRLLTEEVNAAVAGFIEGGFDDILVCDGHGAGAINIELLDPRVRLSRGWCSNKLQNWPLNLDTSFDALAFVGQHAKAGTEFSHLTHTGWWSYIDISINGVSVGEYGELVLTAGERNVPVIFASGEKALCAEAQALTPWVKTAAVLEGTIAGTGNELNFEEYEKFHEGAIHLHPQKARQLIRETARDAAKSFKGKAQLYQLKKPYRLTCKLRPWKGQPARTIEVEHPDSISSVLNLMIAKVENLPV
jgi:D-amino peptidase